MGNKYNEQQKLASEVDRLMANPGAHDAFSDGLRNFRDWNDEWLREKNKEPLRSSPWEMLRAVPRRSTDEHVTGLVNYIYRDEPTIQINLSPASRSSLRYVRLAILHDNALKDDPSVTPIIEQHFLDPKEIKKTWQDMVDYWDGWRDAIQNALGHVKGHLEAATEPRADDIETPELRARQSSIESGEPGEDDGRSADGHGVRDATQAISKTTEGKVETLRDQVFICYSRKDKRWLDDLQTHLKPYVRSGSVTAWCDERVAPGAEWFEEIKRALASTKVAVLLVTKDFFASEFIHEHELTPLLKEAEKGDVRIIWIPIRACAYKETPLKDYQAAIDPEKPLANMRADRDKAWVKICEEIKKAV